MTAAACTSHLRTYSFNAPLRNLRDTPVMQIENEQSIVIPYRELSAQALRGVLESFVLREGTEYGEREVSLEEKVADVLRQLERGEAQVIFHTALQSIDIVVCKPMPQGAR